MSDRDTGINGEVQFQLVGTKSELFSIDPKHGLITVNDNGGKVLDREVKDKYFLQVSKNRSPEISIQILN